MAARQHLPHRLRPILDVAQRKPARIQLSRRRRHMEPLPHTPRQNTHQRRVPGTQGKLQGMGRITSRQHRTLLANRRIRRHGSVGERRTQQRQLRIPPDHQLLHVCRRHGTGPHGTAPGKERRSQSIPEQGQGNKKFHEQISVGREGKILQVHPPPRRHDSRPLPRRVRLRPHDVRRPRRQEKNDGLGTTLRPARLQGPLWAHHRRATLPRLQDCLRRARVPVERPELALCNLPDTQGNGPLPPPLRRGRAHQRTVHGSAHHLQQLAATRRPLLHRRKPEPLHRRLDSTHTPQATRRRNTRPRQGLQPLLLCRPHHLRPHRHPGRRERPRHRAPARPRRPVELLLP